MREVASIETDAAGHPEAEALAAFADGGLAPEKRAAIRAHLARCAECYEVFAETLRFQRELAPASEEGVLRFPFRTAKSIGVWVPAAAAAALALGIGFGVYRYMTATPTANVAELTAPLQGKAGVADQIWREQVLRGGSESEEQFDRDSFHAGVLLVDLGVSLASGSANAAGLSGSIGQLAEKQDFHDAKVVAFYRQAREDLENHRKAPGDLLAAAAARELTFNDLLSTTFLPLGKWAEAGRLAAATRQPKFFERRNNRRFLSWIEGELRKDLADADEPGYKERVGRVLRSLQSIQTVWDHGDFRPETFEKLAAAFADLIDVYDPKGG